MDHMVYKPHPLAGTDEGYLWRAPGGGDRWIFRRSVDPKVRPFPFGAEYVKIKIVTEPELIQPDRKAKKPG